MLVYRAMNREEYRTLIEEGFEATFKRRWKYFTMDPEYIYIIFHEPNYGLCPKIKYHIALRFRFQFIKPITWLLKNDLIRIFMERKKYMTIAMRRTIPYYIKTIEYEEIDPDKLSRPEPLLIWRNKKGETRMVFREDKAKTILSQLKHRERIIYISDKIL